MKRKIFFQAIILLCIAIIAKAQTKPYTEKYRPRFHFTPKTNWTNDPNGLVFYKGQYHLFYQHNPFGNVWGHMSWGHAISTDLVHWKHSPLAIPEENKVMIFSGSAVIDEHNTSKLATKPGEIPMVAIYTGHYIADSTKPDDYTQAQYIAYSLDGGIKWKKYANNPVLDLQKKDFRDPCVFWYAPKRKWVMAVVLPHEHIVQFYGSPNLIKWEHLSDFGPAGDINDIWECPSLLQVPVVGIGFKGKKKWVLFNSQQTTMQYFVGEFDGTKFTSENPSSNIYRPDYGPDYYAGITYNNLPPKYPPILLGWANNWKYANDIPTAPWKSMMALPRQLSLQKMNDAWILFQQPVSAIYGLRSQIWQAAAWQVENEKPLQVQSQQCEMMVEWEPAANSTSGILAFVGGDHKLVIGYDAKEQKLFMDRKDAGDHSFNKNFEELSRYETKLALPNKKLKLNIFIDHSVVEVFANDGEAVMTMQVFSEETDNAIKLFSENGSNLFKTVKVWEMRAAW